MTAAERPGDRLERALQAWLAAAPTTQAEGDALLAANPELADLLTPMIGGGEATDAAGDERVLGDFRLVREIGRGGMGIVYEAWQRSLDRRTAVKVLAPALVASPAAVARFRREANAIARLQHANIVEVLGFGSEGDEHFFAMQFVEGAPLHECAARFRSPPAAVALLVQLVAAIEHAHAAGLVHRDIKPANVLVRSDGTALLTDFGVAHDTALPSLTRAGGFLGTLDYASPEQLRGEPVDGRTDVWSAGVLLHELLTGSHPFTTPTQQGTLQRILLQEPALLRGRPGISDDLAAIVDHTLSKNPLQRYATASKLLADLRALQSGATVSVRLPNPLERLQRWARREPWRVVAAAILLCGLPMLAGTVGYLWANAGRIESAAQAERQQAREELLSNASVYLVDGNTEAGLAALATFADGDDEAAVLRALLHMRAGANAAAAAALQGHQGPLFTLVTRFLAAPQRASDDADFTTIDPFECFVRAHVLFDAANHRGQRPRPLLIKALQLARTATILAPVPRLNYLTTLANAADLTEDRAMLRSATRAIEIHFPNSAIGMLVRARCLSRHDPERALPLFDAVERAVGPSARLLAGRGLALEHLGRLDDAIAANRAAVDVDERHHVAWHNLGACLRKRKALAEAAVALRRSLAANPNYAPAWNTLGLTLRDSGDTPEALVAFTRALEMHPDYAAAALNLGNLQMRNGATEAAIEAFQRAAAADPEGVRGLSNLGDALAHVGRTEEALQWALRAAHLAPNELIANYNAAQLALQLRLPRLALPFAARARDAGKQDPHGLEAWAAALLAQEPVDWPSALSAARAADAAHRGNDVDTRILVARALHGSGDPAAATASLQAALAEPQFAAAAAQQKLQAAIAAPAAR